MRDTPYATEQARTEISEFPARIERLYVKKGRHRRNTIFLVERWENATAPSRHSRKILTATDAGCNAERCVYRRLSS